MPPSISFPLPNRRYTHDFFSSPKLPYIFASLEKSMFYFKKSFEFPRPSSQKLLLIWIIKHVYIVFFLPSYAVASANDL